MVSLTNACNSEEDNGNTDFLRAFLAETMAVSSCFEPSSMSRLTPTA